MAIRMKTTVQLKARGACPSHSLANVTVRDLTFAIDEPVERGGSNLGPTPTDMAISALIGCTNVIGHKCAARLGVDLGHLSIDLESDFDRRGVTLSEEIEVPFPAIRQVVVADGPVTEAELQSVAVEVEKYCPISKLFINSGSRVETIWKKA